LPRPASGTSTCSTRFRPSRGRLRPKRRSAMGTAIERSVLRSGARQDLACWGSNTCRFGARPYDRRILAHRFPRRAKPRLDQR
jgi:hypothetical protein